MSQITALLITLAIEIPIMVFVAWMWRSRVNEPLPVVAVVAGAASLVTHPFAWWLNQALAPALSFGPRATVIETLVVAAEMVVLAIFARMAWRTAGVASFVANMASFGFGLIWFYWLR